jgi:hypothetical protein
MSPTRRPRTDRRARDRRRVSSSPPSRTCPPPISAFGGSSRTIVCAVVDLPEPDPPTSATVSPGATVKLTSRTALTVSRRER